MTNIAYSTHITNSHEHIYIQHMLPIVASFIRTYTKFHQYYIVSSIGSKFHKVKTKTKYKHSINPSFRDLKQICKMGKKVRRRLEEDYYDATKM